MPKRTRRETRASDAGDADASEEKCIPSKARESDKQQRRRERETVRESERVRCEREGERGWGRGRVSRGKDEHTPMSSSTEPMIDIIFTAQTISGRWT